MALKPHVVKPVIQHVLYGPRHHQFKEAIGQFITRSINPLVDSWEEAGAFPAHRLFKQLGQLGVFGVNKPEGKREEMLTRLAAFGGLGLDFSYSIAVAEEMGKVHCAAIPMAVAVQSDMATPALADFGSDELRREFLVPTLSGELVACIGVSEPGAGSDVAAISTTATRAATSTDLIISGSKQWITNGYQADWVCLLVNTNKQAAIHKNKSLVCVRLDEPGVTRLNRTRKLGMHASDTAELFFDEVRVPARNMIGDEGRGFVYQMLQFQDERLVAVAVLLEPLQRVINLTIDYTRERHAFGMSVLDNQVVHYRLAELQTELEAVRALLYRAVQERLQGQDVTLLASMAKLKSARLARIITDSCLQYWGGQGFTWDNPVCRLHRDLRLFSIAAGCDEVMLSIICKYMNTLKKP